MIAYAARQWCPQCRAFTDHLREGETVICADCQARLVWARCRFLAAALTDWPDEVRTLGPLGGQFGVPASGDDRQETRWQPCA